MARGGKGGGKKSSSGKKARAKAKVDRHWGQHVDDDEIRAAKYRKGRSRLLKQKEKNGGNRSDDKRSAIHDDGYHDVDGFARQRRLDDNVGINGSTTSSSSSGFSSDGDSDADMESSLSDNGVGGALDSLLSSIGGRDRKRGDSHRRNDVSVDAMDDDSDEDGVSTTLNQQEDEQMGSDEEDEDVVEVSSDEEELDSIDDDVDSGTTGTSSRGEDGFASHFNMAPLPESDDALAEAIAPLQKVRKVPCGTSHLDSSLEVVLSGPILDRLQATSPSGRDAGQTFTELSSGYYSNLRQVLTRNWKRINSKSLRLNVDANNDLGDRSGNVNQKKRLTSLQSTIYPSLSSYADLQLTAESRENRHDIHNLLALHVLNHVLTSRGRVQKHNKRMKELREREANEDAADSSGEAEVVADGVDEERWRDQGYTRPKVLIMLPTRGTALAFVQRMVSLMGESAHIDHLDRFQTEFSVGVDNGDDYDDNDNDNEEGNLAQRRRTVLQQKGADWNELFGEKVNDDDDFKLGISMTPNAARRTKRREKSGKGKDSSGGISVKFFSEFYRSDIILASPLALKMATSGDEDKDYDVDFLSSIEVCLVLHADVLLMQNWDHVTSCLNELNQQPTKTNETDFSRVRNYLLAGQAAYWKQLVFVSRLADPFIMSTFKRHAKSVGGRLKLRRKVPADEATVCDVLTRVRQVFQRVPCSIQTQGDDRLKYFGEKVLPQIVRLRQKHTLIYIPSYFDFVSLRNLLMKADTTASNFVSVTEYSRVSEVSRGRARFNQGRKAIMLYTGRAHFFLRHGIKGARHLILFGLPEHAEFYPELMNMLMEGASGESEVEVEAPSSCLALFTKYDAHALERIVGTKHCERMVKGEKSTFLFCS